MRKIGGWTSANSGLAAPLLHLNYDLLVRFIRSLTSIPSAIPVSDENNPRKRVKIRIKTEEAQDYIDNIRLHDKFKK